jgi:hypothetical protein
LVKEEQSPASDDYKDPDQGDHQGAAENRLRYLSTKIIQHLITLKIKIGTGKEEDGELKKTVYIQWLKGLLMSTHA